jgi:hypothetical protein
MVANHDAPVGHPLNPAALGLCLVLRGLTQIQPTSYTWVI